MLMRVHYLQDVSYEEPGCILDWSKENAHEISSTRLFENEVLPELDAIDCLVVMGGPMNIYDEINHSWLKEEKRFILEAIEKKKKVLGICLGAQLIAQVLGATIVDSPAKEIGFFPIQKTSEGKACELLANLPDEFPVFHWHGDMFNIPEGGISLFKSEGCPNQGFLYKENVLGLQFHAEVKENDVVGMLHYGAEEIVPSTFIQAAKQIREQAKKLSGLNEQMKLLLQAFMS